MDSTTGQVHDSRPNGQEHEGNILGTRQVLSGVQGKPIVGSDQEVNMQSKWISKLSLMAAPALMGCCLLLPGTPAGAQSCSNATLQGAYGYHAQGALLPTPTISLTFGSVGMTRFSGDGHLTWVEHTVVGGVSLAAGWTSATGTYRVNSNCTGTAVVNTPNSPVPLHLSFVIVKDGKEVHSVLDSDSVSTEFTKVDE